MSASDFLRLQETHPETYQRFCLAVHEAVQRSFVQDTLMGGANVTTGAEVRRRTEICARIVRDLYEGTSKGNGYSVERIVDELPKALRKELDGTEKYEPPKSKRMLWVPPKPLDFPGDYRG